MQNTKRYCLTLDLIEDDRLIEEYKYWHKPEHIWKEITEGIGKAGILDMEIYLLGNHLFMILETIQEFEFERNMKILSQLPRQKEWEKFVSKFQKVDNDRHIEKWHIMERIFKLS